MHMYGKFIIPLIEMWHVPALCDHIITVCVKYEHVTMQPLGVKYKWAGIASTWHCVKCKLMRGQYSEVWKEHRLGSKYVTRQCTRSASHLYWVWIDHCSPSRAQLSQLDWTGLLEQTSWQTCSLCYAGLLSHNDSKVQSVNHTWRSAFTG